MVSETEWKRHLKLWYRAYDRISKISGFSTRELISESLVLVIDKNNKYFGKVGIVENSFLEGKNQKYRIKFMVNKKYKIETIVVGKWIEGRDEKVVISSRNAPLFLEEIANCK